MSDKIQLYVNGKVYEGWKTASVERSVESVSGSFSLDTGDKWEMNRDPLVIKPGDKCVVKINSQPVITGWVDSSSRSADATNHSVAISGRDATCDLVDCSAIVKSFELRGVTLAALARMLCEPFGISVEDQAGDAEVFPTVAIQPGESVWDCLDRQARQRDVTVITNGAGSLVLCRLGKTRAVDKLVIGKNLLNASVDLDISNLFSSYTVKAQMPAAGDSTNAWNAPQNAVEGSASDANVKRYRPLVITSESQAYDKSASLRAEREKRRRIGEAVEVTADVAGWTQSDGTLWPLGAVVGFKAPQLGFSSEEFIISAVSNTIDENGVITKLTLRNPDAFLSDEEKEKQSSKTKKKSKSKSKKSAKKAEDYSKYWGD